MFNIHSYPFNWGVLDPKDPWQKDSCSGRSLFYITYTCKENELHPALTTFMSNMSERTSEQSVYIESEKGLYERWKTSLIFNEEKHDTPQTYSSYFCNIVFHKDGQYYIGGPGSLFIVTQPKVEIESIGSIVNITFRKDAQNQMTITPYIMDNLVRQPLKVTEDEEYHLYYQTSDINIHSKFVIKIGGKFPKPYRIYILHFCKRVYVCVYRGLLHEYYVKHGIVAKKLSKQINKV